MSRRALIIGAPDSKIPGVKVDVENYRQFLESPLGGYWHSSKITTLICPSKAELSEAQEELADADYSLVIFAGHGCHSRTDDTTILWLQDEVKIDSVKLRKGADKHTLIIDACRVLSPELLLDSKRAIIAKSELLLSASECRKYYKKRISDCAKGLVVGFSCKINESSQESAVAGGYYSSPLIGAAHSWMNEKRGADLQRDVFYLSVTDAHDTAAVKVHDLSGGRQNPTSEYPRTTPHFPFAVLA